MGAGVSPAAPSVVLGHRGNWVSGADGGSVRRYGRRRENSPDLPRRPHRVHGGAGQGAVGARGLADLRVRIWGVIRWQAQPEQR